MAIEKIGQMTYVDEAGNEYLLFPKTKAECVEGLTPKAVGAAPAGYGLGAFSNIPHLADIDNPTGNGWFFYQVGNIYACVCVEGYASSYMIETMYDFYNGDPIITRRANFGYGWRAWEYVNPPMTLFTEYRTTERWNGKVVYTMLFDFGAMPGKASAKQLTLPDGLNPGQIIRCEASSTADVTETFPAYNEGPIIFFARQDNVRCENMSSWNMSYFGAKVRIWYTKD